MVDNIIDAAEVVDSFHDVVDARVFRCDAKGVGLKNVTRLFFGQAAAFDVVGVVGQVYLYSVIDPAFHLGLLLFAQGGQQWRHLFFTAFGQGGLDRNVPCFSREERPFDFALGAIVAGGTLADAVFFGKLTG